MSAQSASLILHQIMEEPRMGETFVALTVSTQHVHLQVELQAGILKFLLVPFVKNLETVMARFACEKRRVAMFFLVPTIHLKVDVPTQFGCLGKVKPFQFLQAMRICVDNVLKVTGLLLGSYPLFGKEIVFRLIWVKDVLFVYCVIVPFVKTFK